MFETIARRHKQWQNLALGMTSKTKKDTAKELDKKRRPKTVTEAQQINKLTNTGKISRAPAKLTVTSTRRFFTRRDRQNQTVKQTFFEKHPPSEPIDDNYNNPVSIETIPFHPLIINQIISKKIKKAAVRTHKSQQSSGLDAYEYRHDLTHFGNKQLNFKNQWQKWLKKTGH